MSEKPNYYAVLPADVRYDETLRPNAKLLYAEITALCSKNGFCSARNDYFSTLYKISKKTVSELVSQLVGRGYIALEILRDGKGQVIERRLRLPESRAMDGKTVYPPPIFPDTPFDGNELFTPETPLFTPETPDSAKKPQSENGAACEPPPKNRDTSPQKTGDPPPKNQEDLIGRIIQEINTPIVPQKSADIWTEYAQGDGELLQTLRDFEQMRQRKKKPMTGRAKKMLLNKLDKLSDGRSETRMALLETAILHCWDTVYPLKEDEAPRVRSELEEW